MVSAVLKCRANFALFALSAPQTHLEFVNYDGLVTLLMPTPGLLGHQNYVSVTLGVSGW